LQGECEHRRVKRYWVRSNHRLIAQSLANQARRERLLRVLKNKQERLSEDGELPQTLSTTEYVTSKEGKEFKDARSWMQVNNNDPFFNVCINQYLTHQQITNLPQDFFWQLKRHLSRLLKQKTEPTNQEMLDLAIEGNNQIYQHRTLRVNYTSYNLQRHSDLINIRTRPDLMVLSEEEDHIHPYQYGRLIDIFTVPIHYKGSKPIVGARRQKLRVLWVRWYERDTHYEDGFSTLRLPRLSFVDTSDPGAHGFIDPTAVLRAAHLIPAFHHDLMDPQPLPDCHATRFLADDWNYYYANMYVPHHFSTRYIS